MSGNQQNSNENTHKINFNVYCSRIKFVIRKRTDSLCAKNSASVFHFYAVRSEVMPTEEIHVVTWVVIGQSGGRARNTLTSASA
jgi:hypothetical protein